MPTPGMVLDAATEVLLRFNSSSASAGETNYADPGTYDLVNVGADAPESKIDTLVGAVRAFSGTENSYLRSLPTKDLLPLLQGKDHTFEWIIKGDSLDKDTVNYPWSIGGNFVRSSPVEFSDPKGVAVGPTGILYVADTDNHVIRCIAEDGQVTTLAGTGIAGFVDGAAATCEFFSPTSVAVDSTGTVYVADSGNNRIRTIRDSVVTTLAGTSTAGHLDGPSALFHTPRGVAVDGSGTVYVADSENNSIRKITKDGHTSTVAGTGNYGSQDGNGPTATFSAPQGIAIDATGVLYVADSGCNKIRKIDANGNVSTLAGTGMPDCVDGPAATAEFSKPCSVAIGPDACLYVTDTGSNRIRKLDLPTGTVTTFSGSPDAGWLDGQIAEYYMPTGVCSSSSGVLFIADAGNSLIRKIDKTGLVTTYAGNGISGFIDGHPAYSEDNLQAGLVFRKQNTVCFEWQFGRGNRQYVAFPAGSWTTSAYVHLAVAIKMTPQKTWDVHCYWNGQLVATKPDAIPASGGEKSIMSVGHPPVNPSSSYWKGMLSQVRISKKFRSPAELSQSAGLCFAKSVAIYKMRAFHTMIPSEKCTGR